VRVWWLTLLALGCSDPQNRSAVDASVDAACAAQACDDGNVCTQDRFDPISCSCVHDVIANCCGNGRIEAGEFCDDGNQATGDGCSSNCRIETGMVLRDVTFLPGTEGCDLDGDGSIDNVYGGSMNDAARNEISSLVTGDLQGSCSQYVSLWLFTGSSLDLDGAFVLSLQLGVDATVPAAPSRYFSGNEPFFLMPDGLDAQGQPRSRISGMAPGGQLTTQVGPLVLYLPSCMVNEGRLRYEFGRASIQGTLTTAPSGPTALAARFCGAETVPTLYYVPNTTGFGGATLLDLAVIGVAQFGYQVRPVQPDMDLDGDGLETFRDTDGDSRIDLCIDGNGTQISGTDCPTDPRIADGYSIAVDVNLVGARLAGPRP
jgi:cysteine-rich repeat protein